MGSTLTTVLPAWLYRRTVGGAAAQRRLSSRWQAFRQAALATPYYKRHPIAKTSAIELAEFYAHHAEFFDAAAAAPLPPALLSAVWDPLPPKTIAICPWFRLLAPVETEIDMGKFPIQGCDVLAAPAGVLDWLTRQNPGLPSPAYGIIAFTGMSQRPLTPADRDLFWEVWRTPVFEQYRGFQGELLGSECQAFAGLHFDQEVAVWEERSGSSASGELVVTSLTNLRHPAWRLVTGRRGRVEHAACECGSTLPRVVWEERSA